MCIYFLLSSLDGLLLSLQLLQQLTRCRELLLHTAHQCGIPEEGWRQKHHTSGEENTRRVEIIGNKNPTYLPFRRLRDSVSRWISFST